MKRTMFRRLISLSVACVMILGMTITGQAVEKGMTRAEMAQFLVISAGYSQEQIDAYAAKTSSFSDVAEGSAYEGAINLAYAEGMLSGVGAGKFAPDAKATQREAATVLLKMYDIPSAYLTEWPADYDAMAKWSGLTEDMTYDAAAAVTEEMMAEMVVNGMFMSARPVIGISWKSASQNYDNFKQVIYDAGGMPVELPQIKSSAVKYGEDSMVMNKYLMDSGNLKTEYAEIVKDKNFSQSNVAQAMAGIDGVFFTGGEDISPSLYAKPQTEANEGEEINATRDISDYTLMAYCIEQDIPSFAVCRGQQMMSIVSGSGFVQDIPNYFEAKGAEYPDTHRMPVGAPNRTYARHDVDIKKDSKWLYDIVGSTVLEGVSSWHHQMAELPSENLTVVATTTVNGITTIEAVERQDKTFCLGVQFHPENDCVRAFQGEEELCDVDACQRFFETLVAYAADRPVIGISWKSDSQNYESFKQVIIDAGGIPVEMPQIKSSAVTYGEDNMVNDLYLMSSGNLKTQYAEIIKSNNFSKTNVAQAVEFKDIDGMFFTGGEDISPSLYALPQTEANEGEEINATRDISDYTLMAYCIEQDIPTFAVCRGQQMMSIVSGSGFVQDIPNYFEAKGAEYPDTHRMPVGAPNRTYARHDVDIKKDSKWLYDIVGSTVLEGVSSWHHQMAELPSENLTVVASTTVNGITTIEAVERQDKTFCLGVQFHPENDCVRAMQGQEELCDLETCQQFFETLVAYADDRPVIGISWMYDGQDYEDYKFMIRTLGGIPVEMPQVKSTAVEYGEDNMLLDAYIEQTGKLKTEYAEIIKSKDFSKSNVAEVAQFKEIDGMFFTGGEDISPSLYAKPQAEANEGEEINATRDISDYTLMAYCIEKDIPTFAVCRGQQMMSVVSGSSFIQDIPNYFESKGAEYPDTHRMPVGAPNRTYARHDVDILDNSKWLYDIVGNSVLEDVSSWHHQAADMTDVSGTNLTVVAKKVVNGVEIIEAVERQDKTFCLGVQFHPENDVTCAIYWDEPSEVRCDLDSCMNFFRTLISYAASK